MHLASFRYAADRMQTISTALSKAGIDRLDAELLLAFFLEKDRAWLLSHGDTFLHPQGQKTFDALVARRKKHEPVAYITNSKEFYGRAFFVDPRVLIPRPSTETLIDEVKNVFQKKFEMETPRTVEADSEIVILTHLFPEKIEKYPSIRPAVSALSCRSEAKGVSRDGRTTRDDICIVDIGTGSGCIAVTLALEIPNVNIIATDISSDALEVAKMNAKKHDVSDRIKFFEGEGLLVGARHAVPLQSLDTISLREITRDDMPFFLVSNPPYIPKSETLPPDVSDFEPHAALFAGADGMDVLTPLIHDAKNDPLCIGFSMEMRQEQAKKLMTIL